MPVTLPQSYASAITERINRKRFLAVFDRKFQLNTAEPDPGSKQERVRSQLGFLDQLVGKGAGTG
jgi:hypothetical protein